MENKQYHNALPVNYKLHWYVIKEVLGRGGFGITYLAIDTNLDRKVAIKEFLPSELCYRDNTDSVNPMQTDSKFQYDWGLERFLSEAKTLAKFEHPNIVRVIAVFEENKTGYMVMNYEEGDELQELLSREKTLDEDFLLLILFPLLDGLEKIHNAGFIHRDIKPQNIMLRPNGTPILIDFGSARQALGGKTSTLTSLVSPGYAPFEQYYSKGDKQGPWTDIYALAATLYRCVSGKLPLSAVDRSEGIVHGTGDYFVSAVEIGKGRYSEEFLKAIDRGLCFKPEERPQTIAEWRKDFAGLEDIDSDNFIDDEDYDDETPTIQAIENKKPVEKKHDIGVKPDKKRNVPAYITGTLLFVAVIFLLISNWQKIPGYIKSIEDQFVVSEENKNKEKINSLLEKAENSLAAQQLIEPQDQSAYFYYNEILKIDSKNVMANNGLDKVFIGLFEKSKTAINNGSYEQAEKYLAIADQLKPDSEIIRLSRKVLNEKQAEQKQLEAKKKEQEIFLDEIKQKKEKITSLLDLAASSLEKNQLISPQGNNARYHYKQVLQLEPDNDQALAGLKKISQTYITKSEEAINLKDFLLAKEYLAIAEQTSSGDSFILKSTKELEDQINQQLEVTDQKNKQINQVQNLLSSAEQDMKALRLTSPAGNNALEKYNNVLGLDPSNKTALSGLTKISEKYLALARNEMEKGNLNKAHDQLTTARKISPDLTSVTNAMHELEMMMANEEKQNELSKEQQRIEEEKRRLAEEQQLRNEEQQRLIAEEQQKKQQALEAEIEKLKAEKENEKKLQEQNEIFSITVSQVANKYQSMGFNPGTLANEIAALLRNYGFKVIQQQNAVINNGSVMEVIFQPKDDSTGKLVQWDATVSANYLGNTVWSENGQKKGNARELYGVKVLTEPIDDLRPAQEAIKKMVGNFITRYRGNWPPKY